MESAVMPGEITMFVLVLVALLWTGVHESPPAGGSACAVQRANC